MTHISARRLAGYANRNVSTTIRLDILPLYNRCVIVRWVMSGDVYVVLRLRGRECVRSDPAVVPSKNLYHAYVLHSFAIPFPTPSKICFRDSVIFLATLRTKSWSSYTKRSVPTARVNEGYTDPRVMNDGLAGVHDGSAALRRGVGLGITGQSVRNLRQNSSRLHADFLEML